MHHRQSTIQENPPLIIDEAVYDYLYRLAEQATQTAPDVGEYLLEEVSRARPVPSDRMPADVVRFGSWVTYREVDSGAVRRVQLVYPCQADVAAGRISVVSPLGAALIGLSVGQTMRWHIEQRADRSLQVVGVEPGTLPG
ncbi:nucleoside diphosphate kinase regulator [Algiphilus aromaticivorans]|jgi:regulator of nucleoside diphosphate kinase|uniref:nucleoside diphosphate kinase regulator n=1 Tax=Algiphilus aromaticivorans TaxID=382454 RepID=UPI0005C1633F|nr:nucleoside diphosphate kinase regulator [Algiphilus aromaticivorans]